jgi:putative lipoic acid-binding regulatory protein
MAGVKMNGENESLLQFPCDFSIKAMGKAEPDFDQLVYELIRRHVPDIHEGAVRSRPSKGGKWVSVTVTVRAQNKDQLDAIYMDLTAHEKVVMAL